MKSKILIGMLLFGSLIHVSDDAFIEAVSKDNVNEVKRLLASGINLYRGDLGRHALVMAIERATNDLVNPTRSYEIIQALLQNGVNINEKSQRRDRTLLMEAILGNDYKAAKILIEFGADIDINSSGKTALDYAKEMDKANNNSNFKSLCNNYESLLAYFPNIQIRKINLSANSLTIHEYIAEKTKNLPPFGGLSEKELLEKAQENEVDYIYRNFFPAYKKFLKRNNPFPLIQFFCDFIAPKPDLLGIMASKIFISTQALYDCLKKLAENANDINKILNELLKQTEIIIRMNNLPPIHRLPVKIHNR